MRVLSLFDGISCGQLALERAEMPVEEYYASEICDYAIKIAKKNFPNTIEIGDVRDIKCEDFKDIDLLIGGSPCQSFSFAGVMSGMTTKEKQEITTLKQYLELKEKGFEFEGYSYLFWEYVRILKGVKPKYFLLENVKMAKKWEKVITDALGVQPIMINSELVSAQSRERLYWTNIPNIEQPEDKHIYIDDIIQTDIEYVYLPKTRLDYSNYDKSKVDKTVFKNTATQIGNSRRFGNAVRSNGKAFTLRRINPNGIIDENYNIREFTPIEAERLQTVPDNFTLIEGIKKKDKTKGIEKYWLADKLCHNLGDMMKIEALPDCDLLKYSTPCTDLSIAGQQEGVKWICKDCEYEYNPSKLKVETRYNCPNCNSRNIKSTRSGLLYEVERLLVKAKQNGNLPKFLLMENVDALVSKKYIDSFMDWINRLDNLGYNSYYQTINAKNIGIPQNRNRIFCISILKDIDTKQFEFPKPFDSGIRLKNLLETDEKVLEKYFLSDEIQRRLQITDPKFEKNVVGTTKPDFRTIGQRDLVYQKDSVIGALVATDYKQPKQILENSNKPIHIADLNSEKFLRMHEHSRRIYDENGIAPAMHTCGGGNTQCKVGRDNLKIVRKLTPKEAHRLMGFDDIDYERCKAVGMSDTQGYKQSGNSIVTTAITLLVEHLYKAQYDSTHICTDELMVSKK